MMLKHCRFITRSLHLPCKHVTARKHASTLIMQTLLMQPGTFGCSSRCLHTTSLTTDTDHTNAWGMWDDSDWMSQDDDNAEAYNKLDVTKLMPFPEFRNVAAGPVWGKDAYSLVWSRYFESQTPEHFAQKQDEEWGKFIEENGYDPTAYFEQEEFKERYGDRLIWRDYRRNHKGGKPPQKTRKTCFKKGKPTSGNPCPICRDSKILINYKNLVLFNHFVDRHSGTLHHNLRTGVCRVKQRQLQEAVDLARSLGYFAMPSNPHHHNLEHYGVDHLAVHHN